MPAVPIAKGAYKRPDNPEIRLLNMRYEADPANTEDQVSISARPGLLVWKSSVTAPTRCVFWDVAVNAIGIVSGNQVRGYTIPAGIQFDYISGSVPGTQPCTMASIGLLGGALLTVVATGTELYRTDYSTTAAVTLPDSFAATSVDVNNQRFLVTRGGSQRFYWSDVGSTTFNALSYASAESEPDALICVKCIGNEVWLFGQNSIEVWVPTGDADLPYQKVNGRQFGYGCIARQTVAKLEDSLFWVGGKDRIVLQTAPNPTRISDPSIEALLRQVSDITTLNAFTTSVDGHAYYVLNMGAFGSWAYDGTTKAWGQWQTYGRDDFEGRYGCAFGDWRYLVGGLTGQMNFFMPDQANDNGQPIVREFSGQIDLSQPLRCDNLLLDCEVGSAKTYPEDPQILVRYSDDRSKTWSDWIAASLGHKGDFSRQVYWNRLGLMRRPGRVFEWRCSEDLPLMVRKAKVNERV